MDPGGWAGLDCDQQPGRWSRGGHARGDEEGATDNGRRLVIPRAQRRQDGLLRITAPISATSLRDRAQLVRYAYQHGLVHPG